MDSASNSADLYQRLADFEQQNPKVVEAMRLFGMSAEKYQGVLHAMNAPRFYVSDSTTSNNQKQNG